MKKILKDTIQKIFSLILTTFLKNILVRDKLKVATDNLNLATEKLRDEIKVHEVTETVFKFHDVQKILFAHYI